MTLGRRVLAIALVVLFGVRVGWAITHDSATVDEPEYITAGYSYLATHQLRLDPWHPPLALVAAGLAVQLRFGLPFEPDPAAWAAANARGVAQSFIYAARGADGPRADSIIATARVPSLLCGIATIILIGVWSAQLWGERAGLLALALAAFDPNLIAHAAVATPDMMLTCFMLLTMFVAWRYAMAPSRWRWATILACAALAVATKHVGLLLGPLIVIAFAAHVAADPEPRVWVRRLARACGATAAVGAVVLVIAAIVVGPRVFGVFGALAQGVRSQLWHTGHPPVAFLHGAISRDGWWFYYPIVVALKTPLGTLALIAIAAATRRLGVPWTRSTAAFVITPAVLVLVFVMWSRIDIGIRLVLPGYAFAIVIAGRAATIATTRWRIAVIGALVATIASSALAIPNELGYVNEIARVTGGGARWLSDSNLDWGQDLDRLADYLHARGDAPVYLAYFGGGAPSYLGIRHETLRTRVAGFSPTAEASGDREEIGAPCAAARDLVAISVFRQDGILEVHADEYSWLARLEPIAELGSSIRVYDVTDDLDSHVWLVNQLGSQTPGGACEAKRALAIDPKAGARLH